MAVAAIPLIGTPEADDWRDWLGPNDYVISTASEAENDPSDDDDPRRFPYPVGLP